MTPAGCIEPGQRRCGQEHHSHLATPPSQIHCIRATEVQNSDFHTVADALHGCTRLRCRACLSTGRTLYPLRSAGSPNTLGCHLTHAAAGQSSAATASALGPAAVQTEQGDAKDGNRRPPVCLVCQSFCPDDERLLLPPCGPGSKVLLYVASYL